LKRDKDLQKKKKKLIGDWKKGLYWQRRTRDSNTAEKNEKLDQTGRRENVRYLLKTQNPGAHSEGWDAEKGED